MLSHMLSDFSLSRCGLLGRCNCVACNHARSRLIMNEYSTEALLQALAVGQLHSMHAMQS